MNILLTGGAGFIGSHLVDRLLGGRNGVTCIDNYYPFYDTKIKRRNIEDNLNDEKIGLAECDIRVKKDLEEIFGVEYLFIERLKVCRRLMK